MPLTKEIVKQTKDLAEQVGGWEGFDADLHELAERMEVRLLHDFLRELIDAFELPMLFQPTADVTSGLRKIVDVLYEASK